MNNAAVWGLIIAVFVACFVEMVEATTIVMAMGFTRSWRSALLGTVAALAALAVFTVAAGYALANWLEPAVLKLVIGTLLLIFGLQWLRKAIYRYSGTQSRARRGPDLPRRGRGGPGGRAGETRSGHVRLHGVVQGCVPRGPRGGVHRADLRPVRPREQHRRRLDPLWYATFGALAAVVIVLAIAVAARKPLSMIPENTLKYGVGLLLVSFGIYWSVGGLGAFFGEPEGIEWPGDGSGHPGDPGRDLRAEPGAHRHAAPRRHRPTRRSPRSRPKESTR